MIKNTLLLFSLIFFIGCQQESRKETQQRFRDRQEAIFERAEAEKQDAPADPTQTAPVTPPLQETTVTEPTLAIGNNAQPENRAGDKVVGVKDGDTIELLRNGETITVRLYGIDTPEKNQDYGQRARQFTAELAFGKYVQLIPHNKDRYGRTVGTIILPDGRSLNEELVRNGFAWHYKAYSNDKNLANLETDARRFKRGLWQAPNPVAPWDFRKNKRSSSSTSTSSTDSKAPVPAGATKRTVYLCNSSGSAVYHLTKDCSVLKRCKAEVLTVTEAKAIREYGRRKDKTCSK